MFVASHSWLADCHLRGLMKVYHIVYEPTYRSLDIHVWTKCNLNCRCCYTNYEKYDFGLIDDPIGKIATKPREGPPSRFLSFEQVMGLLRGMEIRYVVFMGTEPTLDPEIPKLAKALHDEFH